MTAIMPRRSKATSTPQTFAEQLRAWKEAWGYTIGQCCDNLVPGTEIKERTMADWLNDRRTPPDYTQALLADKLRERPE